MIAQIFVGPQVWFYVLKQRRRELGIDELLGLPFGKFGIQSEIGKRRRKQKGTSHEPSPSPGLRWVAST